LARDRTGREVRASEKVRPSPEASAGLRSLARAIAPPRDPASDECRKLLDALRKRCPELLHPDPLKPGEPGPEIPLDPRQTESLLRAAARASAGDSVVLWDDGENRLLVHAAETSVLMEDGIIAVRIPVECDQTRKALVQVAFAVGSAKRPAGLLATTESRPRGPAAVVDIWGEALIAFAWQAMMRVCSVLSAASGTDLDGAGLVPLSLTASRNGLSLRTLARHEFDRVVR
jgi:hypothetical protein